MRSSSGRSGFWGGIQCPHLVRELPRWAGCCCCCCCCYCKFLFVLIPLPAHTFFPFTPPLLLLLLGEHACSGIVPLHPLALFLLIVWLSLRPCLPVSCLVFGGVTNHLTRKIVFYVIRCFLRDPNYLLLTLQCEHVFNRKQSLFGSKNTNMPPRNTGSSVNTFHNTCSTILQRHLHRS